MTASSEVLSRIPHREPFLWVDEIIDQGEDFITTRKRIPADLEVFRGHYPDNPIMPGVLLCESLFQSGALLLSSLLESGALAMTGSIPVITRIESAKFKRQVGPGDTLDIKVQLKEILSSVCFMKGTLKVNGKTAVQTHFACAVTDPA